MPIYPRPYHFMKSFQSALLLSIVLLTIQSSFAQSQLVALNKETNKLQYTPYTTKGDIIPDFSFSGYKGGGIPFPNSNNIIKIKPVGGDNTQHIQNAIDQLEETPPDKNGLRGVILMGAGKWPIAGTIQIQHSGIILRGENGKQGKTLLVATTPRQYTLIQVGNNQDAKADAGTKRNVTDAYVPSGTKNLTLDDASGFKTGDQVIVERPSTREWIKYIGMDNIDARWAPAKGLKPQELSLYKDKGRLSADGTQYNTTEQWAPGSKNLKFERTITAIKGNQITLDIPLTNALQKEFGGATVYRYSYKNRITEVGIEQLSAESLFDSTVVSKDGNIGQYHADENHGWTFLNLGNVENAWVDHVDVTYFSFGFICGRNSRYVTIQNCKFLDPVSLIQGGRRYGYTIGGQQCLVYKCYARNGRHDFVLGSSVAGPNAFVEGKAELCHAASEPHQRWSTGVLWDNIHLSGPQALFSISNRGSFGTGHGWTGAQMVLWNCSTPLSVVMSPPTGQNFSFGTKSIKDTWTSSNEQIQKRVSLLNKVAHTDFKYTGKPTVGDAFVFSDEEHLVPVSLYFQQLKDRNR
jgi:hypothetical protein